MSRVRGPARWLAGLAIAAVVCLLPFLGTSNYFMSVAVVALTFVVLGQSLNLIYGYTGWLSLAQTGFWGIGAYASAILWSRAQVSPWLAVLLAGVFVAVTAVVIGYPALRLSRTSFIIVTLAFTLLLQILARDWVSLTRGPLGIPGLPALDISIGGLELDLGTAREFYWAMLAWAVLTLLVVYRIVRSRIGRTLQAIRADQPMAEAHGIDSLAYKLAMFVVGAVLTGVAGALYAFYLSVVDPTIFGFYYTQAMLVVVVVGGRASFWGVTLAAIVFSAAPELLRLADEGRLIAYGVVLVLAILLLPGGVAGIVNQRRRLRRRQVRPVGEPA